MISETQILSEEMEKLLERISNDLESTLVNLSGSLKAIANGTRIKIPIHAGYVNFYKSSDAYTMSVWLNNQLTDLPISTLTDSSTEGLDEDIND